MNSDFSEKSSQLCQCCGICCQGVFFTQDNDPEFYGVEPEKAAPGELSSRLPRACPLLHQDVICLIHDDPRRPQICQDYQCQLLKRLLRNDIGLDTGQRIIAEIKALLLRIREKIPVDGSKPFFWLIQDFQSSQVNEDHPCARSNDSVLIDIASLNLLLYRYILPFEEGFLRHPVSEEPDREDSRGL